MKKHLWSMNYLKRFSMIENHRMTVLFWSGSLSLVIIGSLLHFTFQWMGHPTYLAWFFAINESVWEHLKLAYGALLIYSLVEYPYSKDKVNNYLVAKALGLTVISISIVVIFYSYTFFSGSSILWVDISLYVISCLFGQLVIVGFYRLQSLSLISQYVAAAYLLLLIATFTLFSYYPPDFPIFKPATF